MGEIMVCDIPLKETKEITTVTIDNFPEIREIKKHTRTIENREIMVTNIKSSKIMGNEEVEISNDTLTDTAFYTNNMNHARPMDKDEVLQFLKEWGLLWNPVSDEEIEYNVQHSKEYVPILRNDS